MTNNNVRQGSQQVPELKVITKQVEKVFKSSLYPHRRVKIKGQSANGRTVSVGGYGLCDLPNGDDTPILIPYFSTTSIDEYGFPNEGGPQPNDDALQTDTTPGNPLITGQPNLQQQNPYTSDVVAGSGMGSSSYGTYDYNGATAPGKKSKVVKKPKLSVLLGGGLKFSTQSNGLPKSSGGNDTGTSTSAADTSGNEYITVDVDPAGAIVFHGNGLAVGVSNAGIAIVNDAVAAQVDNQTVFINDAGQLTTNKAGGGTLATVSAGKAIIISPGTGGGSSAGGSNPVINVEIASVSGQAQSGLCNEGGDDANGLKVDLASAAGGGASGSGGGALYPWYMPTMYRPTYQTGVNAFRSDVALESNPHDPGPHASWWEVGWRAASESIVGSGGTLPGGGSSSSGLDAVACGGGTKGSGLQIDAGNGNQMAVYLADTGSGLAFGGSDGEGLVVSLASPSGLQVDTSGLSVLLAPTSGLVFDGSGRVMASVDGSSIRINSSGQLAASASPPGFSAGNGITIAGQTISARPDGTTIDFNASGELEVMAQNTFCLVGTEPKPGDPNGCYQLKLDPATLAYNSSGNLTVVGTSAPDSFAGTAPILVSVSGSTTTVAIDTSGATAGEVLGFNGTSVAWVANGNVINGGIGIRVTPNGDGSETISWYDPSNYLANPMVAAGDLIIGGAFGAPTRLPVGSSGQVLTVTPSGGIAWANDDDSTSGGGGSPAGVQSLNGLTGSVSLVGGGTITVSTNGQDVNVVGGTGGNGTGMAGVTSLIVGSNPPDTGDIAFITPTSNSHLVISRQVGVDNAPVTYEFDVPIIGYVSGDLGVTGTESVFGNLVMMPIPHPTGTLGLATTSGFGMGVGAYSYCYTYTTGGGETSPSPLSVISTTSGEQNVILSVPASNAGGITGRNIYRAPINTTGPMRLLVNVPGAAVSTYTDYTPDSQLLTKPTPPTDDLGAIGKINAGPISGAIVTITDHIELNGHALTVGGGEVLLDGRPICSGADDDTGLGGSGDLFIAFDVAAPDPTIQPIWVLYQHTDGTQYKLQMTPNDFSSSTPGEFVPGEFVPG